MRSHPHTADNATLVAHVTLPDYAEVTPGAALTKTWRLHNTGATSWNARYHLLFVGGEQMGGWESLSIPAEVAPGAEIELSLGLRAPASGGVYAGWWQLRNEAGQLFGDRLAAAIAVMPPPGTVPIVQSAEPELPVGNIVTQDAPPSPEAEPIETAPIEPLEDFAPPQTPEQPSAPEPKRMTIRLIKQAKSANGPATPETNSAPEVSLVAIPIRNRLFDFSLDGWETWANVQAEDLSLQLPRFDVHSSPVPPSRVLTGRTSLRLTIEAGKSYEAGVYQIVTGLAPGTPLRFVAQGHAWASAGNNPFKSESVGRANLRIGIDPNGGIDPAAAGIVWSPAADAWDEFQLFEVETAAQAEAVTLFLYSRPSLRLEHNETFWDNAALYATGPANVEAALAPHPQAGHGLLSTLRGLLFPSSVPNLLRNGEFDEGLYFAGPAVAVPNGWEVSYADESHERLERQDNAFKPPEAVVWHIRDAAPEDKRVYFLSGDCCWKVYGAWKPIWVRLAQIVPGLTPGATYRFSVAVYPDPVMAYTEAGKQYALDKQAAESRLSATTGGQTLVTNWQNGNQIPFGAFSELSFEFVAAEAQATVALDLRARWGLLHTGWVIDSARLAQVNR